MLVSYIKIADHVSKNPGLVREWRAIQTTERIKTKISLANFKEIETIRSDNKTDLELLGEVQRQRVQETLDMQMRFLEEKEKVLLDALDIADSESEVNNTYSELSGLVDLGYVRMAELDQKMTARSGKTDSSTSSLPKISGMLTNKQDSINEAGLTTRSGNSED